MRKSFNKLVFSLVLFGSAASAALPPVVDASSQAAPKQAKTSPAIVGMFNRMQQLQNEVQQLRGQLEEQNYLIESLKKRQRDLYLDTDRRLQLLESYKVGASTGTEDSSLTERNQNSGLKASPGKVDKKAYTQAFSILKAGRYQQAIKAFDDFVGNYPNSAYLPNALYWLGEASYVSRDYDRALIEFNKVIGQFSGHSKSKDALLKRGFIFYEKKQWQQARDNLTKVLTDYPNTTVAGLAKQRLDRMLQEKH